MQTNKVQICPHCEKIIDLSTPVHIVRRGVPRFKSYVAFFNMLFLSLLMYLLDFGIHQTNPNNTWWSGYVIIGLWLLYLLGFAFKFRSEEAWLIVPVFFFLISIYIAFIDVTTSNEPKVLFYLSWSFYPFVIITIILVILPLITFTGKKRKMPLELLQEIVQLEHESVNKKE